MTPTSLADFRLELTRLTKADAVALAGAKARNAVLTKPPGALGRLEALAIWLAGWQGRAKPRIAAPQIVIFAGNHGVVAQGVSAFPAEVTGQMVANFQNGGAAINQLAKTFGAALSVVALDLDRPTGDFTQGPAMDEADLLAALQAGWNAVTPGTDLLSLGEMGIGNTTAAAAIACALFGGMAEEWVGRGTGVDDAGLARKAAAVRAGLNRHASRDPLEILRCLGGREIAAMAGALLAARQNRIPPGLQGLQQVVPGHGLGCGEVLGGAVKVNRGNCHAGAKAGRQLVDRCPAVAKVCHHLHRDLGRKGRHALRHNPMIPCKNRDLRALYARRRRTLPARQPDGQGFKLP